MDGLQRISLGNARGARRHLAGSQPVTEALHCVRPVDRIPPAGDGIGCRWLGRYQVRDHPGHHPRPVAQHRLLAGGGGPTAGEPDPLFPLLSGAPRVLPGKRVRLRVRRSVGAGTAQRRVQSGLHPLPLAPYRPLDRARAAAHFRGRSDQRHGGASFARAAQHADPPRQLCCRRELHRGRCSSGFLPSRSPGSCSSEFGRIEPVCGRSPGRAALSAGRRSPGGTPPRQTRDSRRGGGDSAWSR